MNDQASPFSPVAGCTLPSHPKEESNEKSRSLPTCFYLVPFISFWFKSESGIGRFSQTVTRYSRMIRLPRAQHKSNPCAPHSSDTHAPTHLFAFSKLERYKIDSRLLLGSFSPLGDFLGRISQVKEASRSRIRSHHSMLAGSGLVW